jgi:hypothetical protein
MTHVLSGKWLRSACAAHDAQQRCMANGGTALRFPLGISCGYDPVLRTVALGRGRSTIVKPEQLVQR